MNETQCNTKPAEPIIANASVPVLARRVKAKRQLSYAQLNMFLRCPRQYEYRCLHGLKVPPSGAMIQSRVWHQTIELNYRQKIHSDRDLALGEMQESFATHFDARWWKCLSRGAITWQAGYCAETANPST